MHTITGRGLATLLVIGGALTFASAAGAQSEDWLKEQWKACVKTQSAPSPGIAACTAIIGSGKEKGRNLAIAYNNRGDGYWAKDDNDNAFADYDRAIKIDPNYSTAYINRAIIWRRKKNDDAALADLNKAVQLDPKDGYAYNNRGNIWHSKNDLDRALADYEQALRIDDKMATRHANRGNIFRERGDLDRAQTDYSNAIRLDPNFPAAHTGLGLVYEKQGDTSRARAEFQAALDAPAKYDSSDWAKNTARDHLAALAGGNPPPDQDPLKAEWAACTKTQSAPDRGIAACTTIISSGKETTRNLAIAYNNRGDGYWAKDDNDNAFADYDRAVKIDSNYATAYVNRAIIWRRKKNDDAALADLNKAVQLDPKDGYAYNNRGNIWHSKNDLDRALADYEQALRIDDKMATRHANRGNIFRERGELGRAQTDYENAIRLDPNFPAAHTGLGLVLEKQGDVPRARGEFQAALDAPAKFDSSDWAKNTARERLAAIGSGPVTRIDPTPRRDPDPVPPRGTEKRVALVIGNSGYKFVPALPNPRRDAEAIATSLRRVGFTSVVVKFDLSREQSMEALKAFASDADRADWAVVYFAGHGLEMGGVNYLVPVDAQLSVDRNVSFEALPLDQVLASVNGARKLRLVILDACRDNPFLKTMTRSLATRSVGRGLATIEPEGATLVAYAAKHGNVAEDGSSGNSPFVSALIKYVEQPGLEINLLFRKVRDEVLTATGRRQEPYIYGSLPSEAFYFKDR